MTEPSNASLSGPVDVTPADDPSVPKRSSSLGMIKNVALFFIVAMGVMMAYHFIRILSLWGDTTGR